MFHMECIRSFTYFHMLTDTYNNNNKYLYSALSCVTQSAVTQNECNTI